jgi:hypothetical protein
MTATQRTRTTVNISGFFACEEGGEHHLQSVVRPRAPRAGKRAPMLRFPRIDRLGDRECRRRPRERGQDMYGKGRRRGGGGYLARTPASDLWIAGRRPHPTQRVP